VSCKTVLTDFIFIGVPVLNWPYWLTQVDLILYIPIKMVVCVCVAYQYVRVKFSKKADLFAVIFSEPWLNILETW